MSELDPNKVVSDLNKRFDEFKDTHSQEIAEIRKNGVADPLTVEKLEKLDRAVSDLATTQDQIAAKMNRPQTGGSGVEDSEASVNHKSAFNAWVRDPGNNELKSALQAAEREAVAQKAVTVATPASGGYALPEEISRSINEKLLDVSPMRRVARVVQASTTDYKELVDVLGDGYGWVGEGDTRSETDTPSLAEVAPSFGTIYAYPKASEESLNDLFFNVQEWLIRRSVNSFAKGEGIAFISGNGTKKPTGFLNGTPEDTDDDGVSPARAFGTLQYKPTGNASGFGSFSNTSPEHYPSDVFIDTVYSLKAGYRGNASWMMNKATLGTVRKFRDADGAYIWQPGLTAGQPSQILGFNVVEAEDMPDIGANAFPVAFGDFMEGYLICDLVGLRMTIDDSITTPGQCKFYLRKRVGGKLLNDDAIKVIKVAAS
uniref:Putative major capsid protein n=1 Tax=Pseudo-nitzschia multiseries DNA virus TaxID=2364897 RepID=A0A678WAM1_9VIRU|nr:putative major capsid protein [Pseudo-nitzschia multiseries DNA virus]